MTSSLQVLIFRKMKNAAVPIVTIIGIGIALLIGGVVVTESVFNIPGLGRLTIDSVLRRDYPVIQGVILLFSGSGSAMDTRARTPFAFCLAILAARGALWLWEWERQPGPI